MRKVITLLPIMAAFLFLISTLLTGNAYEEYFIISAFSSTAVTASFILALFIVVFILKGMMGRAFILLAIISSTLVLSSSFNPTPLSEDSNIKVATVNLLWDNANNYSKIKESLEKLDPDVVFIQEYNEENDLAGLVDSYEYKAEGSPDAFMYADAIILSKYPLTNYKTVKIYDRFLPYAEIEVNTNKVSLMSVHNISPISKERAIGWGYDLKELSSFASIIDSPLIMAGDFNANGGMQPFRDFMEKSELSATSLFSFTWGSTFGLKITHLDHILTKNGITLKNHSVYDAPHSDHSIVYAELKIED